MKWFLGYAVVLGLACNAWAGTANFNDLSLSPNSYWNGSDGSGGFTSGGVTFANSFVDWGGGYTSWSRFAYSNVVNTTEGDYTNQYASYTGNGIGGKGIYAVGYVNLDYTDDYAPIPSVATLAKPSVVSQIQVTNTTYAALAMLNGTGFSKKFGGTSGNDPDWFMLTVTGINAVGNATGSVDFYLADYRSSNKTIVNTWKTVDLSSLGLVSSLDFTLYSSDSGDFGMNTPAYFALGEITTVPEPASLSLLCLGELALIRRRKIREGENHA